MSKISEALSIIKSVNESKTSDVIAELIKTGWSKDNASQMKAVQLLKGIALSDEPSANKFMKKLDDFTSSLNPEDFNEVSK